MADAVDSELVSDIDVMEGDLRLAKPCSFFGRGFEGIRAGGG